MRKLCQGWLRAKSPGRYRRILPLCSKYIQRSHLWHLLHCFLLQVFLHSVKMVINWVFTSDDARISKFYKGLSCTEISVETGGFCNGDRGFCVIPSTPGNLKAACPNQTGRSIRRGFRARKTKAQKRAKVKHRKKNGGRLVGASSLHTYSKRNPPFRYPWICSVKTRGFRLLYDTPAPRWWPTHPPSRQLVNFFCSGVATSALSLSSLLLLGKLYLWVRPIATFFVRKTLLSWRFVAVHQLSRRTLVMR